MHDYEEYGQPGGSSPGRVPDSCEGLSRYRRVLKMLNFIPWHLKRLGITVAGASCVFPWDREQLNEVSWARQGGHSKFICSIDHVLGKWSHGSSVSGMTLKLMGPARKSRGFLRNKFKRCPKPKLGFSHEIVWMILGLR